MAASTTVTSAMVTIVRSWTTGGTTGKRNKVYLCRIVDAANGLAVGALDSIPATAFGLTRIDRCSNLGVLTTSSLAMVRVYPAMPDGDGSCVVICDVEQGTDGQRADVASPAAVAATTETLQITVEGV